MNSSKSPNQKFLVIVVLAALAAGAFAYWNYKSKPSDKPQLTTETVRIVSWNLQWFPGNHPKSEPDQEAAQMAKALEAVKKLDADIYCFQEIKTEEAAKKLVSAVPGLKLHRVSMFNPDYVPDDPNEKVVMQHLVIASKFPALATAAEHFEEENGFDPPRGFAFAALDAGEGKLILVWTVHLKANSSRSPDGVWEKRETSARQLVKHINDMKETYAKQGWKDPLIAVVGDFNTDQLDERFADEKTFDILKENGLTSDWLNVPLAERVTLPASGRWPDACFDWAFFNADENVSGTSTIGEVPEDISDHRPVVLQLSR